MLLQSLISADLLPEHCELAFEGIELLVVYHVNHFFLASLSFLLFLFAFYPKLVCYLRAVHLLREVLFRL